ncbi:MAG: RecQ family ATP-dependent DNA helicase [Isosphaeraceae bacterium]
MSQIDDARQVLRETFGFEDFRDGQGPVLDALLAGRSTLAIFPTGGGKSLCYQLPALLFDGLTVVVSPLIALMKDQIDFLTRHGVAAARLDSSLDAAEARQVLADLRAGKLKLLYVSPERLAGGRFPGTLAGQSIALLAVDEAHCISEWGHNFRPEYMKLAKVADELRADRVLALTATATPEVAKAIARAFRIDQADVISTGFHRPNLFLHATHCREHQRLALLMDRLKERAPGPAIVYVTLQRTAEDVAAALSGEGFDAVAYHAGLDADRRHRLQDRFMASRSTIVVATIAFGMGIDKADIRAVYHYNLPKSLENYAQEIGRAGRDGQDAHCEVFACAKDVTTLENFSYGDTPTPEAVAALVHELLGQGTTFDVSTYELSQEHDIRPLVVETLLAYLELEGVMEATGAFFSEVKFQPARPSAEILARFDADRAAFLRQIFRQARKAATWFTLDVPAAARASGESRGRIMTALHYLEEQGDLVLKVAGARRGYRMIVDAPDLDCLAALMSARFLDRERRDIDRVRLVVDYARATDCLTRRLLTYFGEDLPADCGHCDRCLGIIPSPLPPATARAPGPTESRRLADLRAEGHLALATPRQQTRFLCGLSSPATVRAKLTRHPTFGLLDDVSFARVLVFTNSEDHTSEGP